MTFLSSVHDMPNIHVRLIIIFLMLYIWTGNSLLGNNSNMICFFLAGVPTTIDYHKLILDVEVAKFGESWKSLIYVML